MQNINPYLQGVQLVELFSAAEQQQIVDEACNLIRNGSKCSFRYIVENLVFMHSFDKKRDC